MFTIGVLDRFSIYNFTMKYGPSPWILGFTSIFEFVTASLICVDIPRRVLHFSNFMLLYSILKLSRVSGSLFQYLRNWGVFFGICSFSYLDYFSC